jgi:predicted aconitase with swiveling domain
MEHIFKGRAILPGHTRGEALVTHAGFNTLACFYKSMLAEADVAVCSHHDNRELYGKILTDKIICLPKTVGSTSAGATWDRVAFSGLAPKAMLFSQHIDYLTAAGLVIADIWAEKRIFTIDQIGDELLEVVKEGQQIEIREDGTVIVNNDKIKEKR